MAVRRRWVAWLSAAAGALVLAGLLWLGDVREETAALAGLPASSVLAAFGVVTVAYALRFGKWHLFVRTLGLPVGPRRSLQVFLGGLMMVVTPAKVGEAWKSVLLAGDGVPVARSLPAVAMERLVDFLAIATLATAGLAVVVGEPWGVAATVLGAGLLVAALRWGSLWRRLLAWAGRRPRLARPARFLGTAYDGAHALLAPRPLGLASAIGLAAWTLEGLALWIVLDGLDAGVGAPAAVAAFCIGTLAGVLSLLPGGLGATEAGMVAVLAAQGVPSGQAVAATLLARVCTIGYGAALGALASLLWPSPAQDGRVVDAEGAGRALEEALDGPQGR